MNTFQKGAAELAQLRQQAVDSHDLGELSVKETELLDRISSARRILPGGRVGGGSSRTTFHGSGLAA